ncbi:hypothetical protein [Actinocatenispora comari]|uniref:Uncharacterized protein n=1 Tax=Actinocatenispora comari TaxID=2807577 RepID=A0A8J4AD89_9ACTN|nr:hypothetical protein [Actinocatenispora comari]GIL29161.1 hypothetical protein NUM_44150 [Actinocatenispora comari]
MEACAPAPYVCRPFVYAWWCAADELGRVVAGQVVARVYKDGLGAC